MTTSTGVTWEPAGVTYGRYWNIEMWYGRYEELCSIGYDPYTLRWAVAPRYPTGGTGSTAPGSGPSYPEANCVTVSPAGTWSRSTSSGKSTVFNAGVNISGLVGFDMKLTANYGTTSNAERIVYYRVTRSSIKLCGNNDTPATAGIVIEKP